MKYLTIAETNMTDEKIKMIDSIFDSFFKFRNDNYNGVNGFFRSQANETLMIILENMDWSFKQIRSKPPYPEEYVK